MVEIAVLGERLSALRLCDAEAITAVRRSLDQYGQLAAVTLFTERDEHAPSTRAFFRCLRSAKAH
jgi:hypothetical protein